jgi:hypothetical protein
MPMFLWQGENITCGNEEPVTSTLVHSVGVKRKDKMYYAAVGDVCFSSNQASGLNAHYVHSVR